jgi:hypothetical protein
MKHLSRAQLVEALRAKLLERTDEDTCLCLAAARLGIYCRGFSQWTFGELKHRYGWIARNRPGVTRAELEDLANRWQLARQRVLGTEVACDTQAMEHQTCEGWDGFDDEQLAGFYRELCGEEVEVVPA